MKTKTLRIFIIAFFAILGSATILHAQEKITVTGTVKNEKGEAIASAAVTEKGTKNGSLTNEAGIFSLKVSKNAKIVVSSIGYNTAEISVSGQTVLNVKLTAGQANQLSDVVVTSMGITKQAKELGYATTTIKSGELVATAPTNFATALYGKAPGVRIAAAPGGSTSGVSIQVRGLTSITGRTQPLIVMDGVPIHDGSFDNTNYWGDQRVRSNGLVDLNPEDIESITVLKGAAAAALYGSEATNGVLLITSKKGKAKKGFSVDASATYFQDRVAYLPRFQDVRGTGVPAQYDQYWFGSGAADANGFNINTYTINGTAYRALMQSSVNFGPAFDGKPIATWDGNVRPYSYIKDGYKHLYQNANNVITNVSLSSVSDVSNTRLSISKIHYEGLSQNSANDRYTFNLNSTYNFGKKVRLNVIANDIYAVINNRPYMIDRLINNFSGMMPTFDDGNWYKAKYQTSLGYKYVTGTNANTLTPNENIKIPNIRTDLLDYFWNVYKNLTREKENRLMASATTYWDIIPGLQFRGRIGTDWTTNREEDKSYSSQPVIYGYTGGYTLKTNDYSVLYGDALLTYVKKLNKDVGLKAMLGYSARNEAGYTTSVGTSNGLVIENRFDLSSSYTTPYSSSSARNYFTTDAIFGTVNANYKEFLNIEGSVRRDRTSTMNPNNNSFVYPSVNASFVLSEAFKLPEFVNYAKLRGSWAIVGNYPSAYQANVAYSLSNLGNQGNGNILATTVSTGTYGNDGIKPERKYELEFGFEAKFLQNRISLDVSYYTNTLKDQILPLSIPQSSGASSILTNIGELKNSGLEVAVNGVAFETKNFSWEPGVNFAFNNNKITKLYTGSNELIHSDFDGNAAVLKSTVGQPVGDFYAHPIKTDASGNPVVVDNGGGDVVYQLDGSTLKKYGNSQVKVIGGFVNNLKYKNFSLEIYTDFRLGGYVMPTGLFWMNSRGLTKESLNHMDAAHGGVSYYMDASGHGIETTAATGPSGQTVYHDGMKLGGVFSNGTPNSYVTPQFYYYNETYNWGGPQYSNSQYFRYIVKNSYWKMREITFSYTLPNSIAKKVSASRLQVSVFARNLFYLYRTIKDMDAEQLTSGLQWNNNLNNAGSQPSSRTFGVSVRASF